MSRIIVSVGHDSKNPGKKNDEFGLVEFEIAKKIARKLTPKLRSSGIISLSVPYSTSIKDRIRWINSTGYKAELDDYLIEFHLHDDDKSGFKIWFDNDDKSSSEKFSDFVSKSLVNSGNFTLITSEPKTKHPQKDIAIVSQTKPKALVVEAFSIVNTADVKILDEKSESKKLDEFVNQLVNGVKNYFNEQSKSKNSLIKGTSETGLDKTKTKVNDSNFSKLSSHTNNSASDSKFSSTTSFNSNSPGLGNGFGSKESSFGSSPSSFNGLGKDSSSNTSMSRDERKKMVKRYFKKAFGKEPENNDVNYFLNIGISEVQFLKRILDSEDHKDLIEKANKHDELKEKSDKLETEVEALKSQTKDQKIILEKLNTLLNQKNKSLAQLQQKSQFLLSRIEEYQAERGPLKVKMNYEMNPWEKFFHRLADMLS